MARNLGVDVKTALGYLNLLVDLLLLRCFPPWHANLGKRLLKAAKIYVRDSGLVRAFLDLQDKEALLSHPAVGASWEGFCIEQVLACVPPVRRIVLYPGAESFPMGNEVQAMPLARLCAELQAKA